MEDKVKKVGRAALGRGLAALISQPPVPIAASNTAIAENQNTVIKSTTTAEIAPKKAEVGKLATIVSLPKLAAPEVEAIVRYVEITSLINNPKQPRERFKEAEIIELASSLKQLGVLQPIVVRPSKVETGKLEIVAGERRWRAAKLAGLTTVPVVIKDLSDLETLEISIVENVQRENLNALEQAVAYQRLIDEFNLSHEEVADRIGKDRATVTNIVRILKLCKEVQGYIADGKISLGHAKALISIKDPNAQISLAKKVINEQLPVRALEALVARVAVLDVGTAKRAKTSRNSTTSSNHDELLERLRRSLGTKVAIKQSSQSRGTITIEYFSPEELTRLVDTICH
jgi:ParB family chromosome partitioning protein